MKFAIFEAEKWERECFDRLRGEHDVTFTEVRLTGKHVEEFADAGIVSTFIYSDLGREVLQELEHLELVATRSTGFDHVDRDYCEEHGITVANVPAYGDSTIAEHVFALPLAVSRHLVEAANRAARGEISHKGLRGCDLRGRILGVIGTGNIGAQVIPIAQEFGMEVVAFDVDPSEPHNVVIGSRDR